MNTYKITNITDGLGKRHPNFNSTLDIRFVDQMERKTMKLEPKKTIYFTATSLPLSLHRFRIKGLVNVTEVTAQELLKLQKEDSKNDGESSKVTKKPKTKTTTTTTTTKKSSGRPKSSKKTTTSYKKTTSDVEKEEEEND